MFSIPYSSSAAWIALRTSWERVRVKPVPLSVSRSAMYVLKFDRNCWRLSERAVVGFHELKFKDTVHPAISRWYRLTKLSNGYA